MFSSIILDFVEYNSWWNLIIKKYFYYPGIRPVKLFQGLGSWESVTWFEPIRKRPPDVLS
jgi:hypothetical protein